MELSANAEKIISQAEKWTFAGDCSLLQWMEEIAENLEKRAITTKQTLGQLSSNLKRTTTALDNATNSLAALQYTQFVESRCHDDDETIANVAEVPVNLENNNQAVEDTNKLWTNFMKKNFEVLHNCHERYSLDFEDSDEEDNANNFIYQAKNPYNERLLPHIYGTSLWKENWHVGLCDGNNEYSGDEMSEAFSESSSITSPEENESYESTAANLSEWASSTSITTEKQQPNLKIQNASSLRGSQPLFPEENIQRMAKVAAGSDTSSSTSRNTLSNIKTGFEQNQPRYDLFAPIQDIPPTSSSSSSSLHQQFSSSAQSNTNVSKDFLNANEEQSPTVGLPVQSTTMTNQIRRRPVNLFDDDDFNNFMTEIVDKVNQKHEPESIVPPVPATRQQSSINSVIEPKEQEKNASINLFDEQSSSGVDHFAAKVQESPKPRSAIAKEEPTKKRTLNLFDDNIDLFLPKTDILATVTQVPPIDVKNDIHTRITAKSLFDDDDEDDDFLNIFASKKFSTTKPTESRLIFTDGDSKHTEVDFEKSERDVRKNNIMGSSPIKTVDFFKETSPLFNDTEEVKEINPVSSSEILENISNEQDKSIPEQIANNMSDEESREDKLFVSSEFSENETIADDKRNKDILFDKVEINISKKSLLPQKKLSLFDDGSESDDDDIFGKSVTVIKPLASKEDNLFGDLAPKSSKVDITKESNKNNSTNFNEVQTSKTTGHVFLEKQDFVDEEKVVDFSQTVTAKEFKNIEDASTNPTPTLCLTAQDPSHITENLSLNKSIIALTDNFEEFGESLEKDYSEKLQEITEKSTEIAQPLVDEVYESAKPVDVDLVGEISLPQANANIKETENQLSDGNSTEITNIISAFENKTPNTYAGLYLDEPPDDDDAFFQSLDNSSLLSSKFSQDLEADFYEPALPKPPADVTNTSKPTIVPPTYNSVGLFSDIPPDDDLEDLSFNKNSTNSSEITKRIHSVFYDDFNETIAAVKKKPTEVSANIHTMFNDEPPSDNDDNDFATILQSSNKEKFDGNTDFGNDKDKPASKDVLDKAKAYFAADTAVDLLKNTKVKNNSSISKLQMPKININVQALLPPSAKKATLEESIDSQIAGKENLPIINNSFNSPSALASIPSASNQNILVNVCKNRVRAPVKRRPSTRRARQENYRKSLIAEQDEVDIEDEIEISTKQKVEKIKESAQATNVQEQHVNPKHMKTPQTPNSFIEISNDYTKDSSETFSSTASYPSKPNTKSLNISKGILDNFENNEEEDFLSNKKDKNNSKMISSREEESKYFLDNQPAKSNIENTIIDNSLEKDHKSKITKQSESISEPKMAKTTEYKGSQKASFFDGNDLDVSKKLTQKEIPAKSLFVDGSESDSDELFGTKKLLQTKNTSSMAKVVETKRAHSTGKSATLFSSDDDDDKIEKLSKKEETTKTFLKKSAVKADNKVLFSDTDDDDDLFGSKSSTKAAVSKSNARLAKAAKNPLSSKQEQPTTKSTITSTKTADNPLADLLNN